MLSLLPTETHARIERYHFPTDRHLALGSALLQRWIICTHYASYCTLSSAPLQTDPASGRPSHAATGPFRNTFGIDDYNITHHKSPPEERCIVALSALSSATPERKRRVGVDIVPTCHRSDGSDFVVTFCGDGGAAGVFTPLEIDTIMAHGSVRERVRCLYLFWALKEAYAKAIGVGVVMDLTRIEFRGVRIFEGQRWRGAEIWVDGVAESGKWYLEVSFMRGILGEGDGFYLAICCEKEGLTDKDLEGEWREMGLVEDIVKPWGGAHKGGFTCSRVQTFSPRSQAFLHDVNPESLVYESRVT
jgi:phosphopantetheinyl transferase